MHDDLESQMKEKLLEGLIEHMSNKMGDDLGAKFPHKAMEVSVAAPDEQKLSEGLDHAKDVLGDSKDGDEGDDEDRLMALLGDKDDEDEEC